MKNRQTFPHLVERPKAIAKTVPVPASPAVLFAGSCILFALISLALRVLA